MKVTVAIGKKFQIFATSLMPKIPVTKMFKNLFVQKLKC